MDWDSDSGDDLDIERNGTIPRSRAERLRSLLARRKPSADAVDLTSSPQYHQAAPDVQANGKAYESQSRQGKQWERHETCAIPNTWSLGSQPNGYIRSAWIPSWQERLTSPAFGNAARVLDYRSSDSARESVLQRFGARLEAVSPEKTGNVLQIDRPSSVQVGSSGCVWESELSRHVQRLIEQAEMRIGSHAEEIKKAEGVLETTLRELTATSTFQDQLLQNKLDFLSKDFEKRAEEIHRQYVCRIEEMKAEVLEKANLQNKQCEAAIQKKAEDLAAALQTVNLRETSPLQAASPEKEDAKVRQSPAPKNVQQPDETISKPASAEAAAEASVRDATPSDPAGPSNETLQTSQAAAALESAARSPLQDVVQNLKPQRLERTLGEVRDWLAESTGAATTPVDSVFSPSSVAAEQGSVNGSSLLSPLVAYPQTPEMQALPCTVDLLKPRPSERNSGAPRNKAEQRNGVSSPPSLQKQAQQLRQDLDRGQLISLTSPDGDLVPVKGTRSPFRDSRPSPSIVVPGRSNPASPLAGLLTPPRARLGDPLESPRSRRDKLLAQRRHTSETLVSPQRGTRGLLSNPASPLAGLLTPPRTRPGATTREARFPSNPLESPRSRRDKLLAQRRATSQALVAPPRGARGVLFGTQNGGGTGSKVAVRVIDLFHSDTESDDDDEIEEDI